jgi:hypothetical protein
MTIKEIKTSIIIILLRYILRTSRSNYLELLFALV